MTLEGPHDFHPRVQISGLPRQPLFLSRKGTKGRRAGKAFLMAGNVGFGVSGEAIALCSSLQEFWVILSDAPRAVAKRIGESGTQGGPHFRPAEEKQSYSSDLQS